MLEPSDVQEVGKSAQQDPLTLLTAEVIQEKNGGVSGMPLCSERKRVRNPIKQGLILPPPPPHYLLRCAQSALLYSALPLSSISIYLIPHI